MQRRNSEKDEGFERNVVFEKAVVLLARREHSQKELIRKLKQKGYSAESISTALDKLIQHDLQSDARFADSYVRSRKLAGFGPRRIAMELSERGIGDALIAQCVNDDANDWAEQLRQVWKKRFCREGRGSQVVSREKEYRFLLQRGYNPECIRRLLEKSS